MNMWTEYQVSWLFLTQLCGSVPADPAIVEAWLSARKPKVKPPGGKSITAIQEEVFATLGEPEEDRPQILTFQRIDGMLCLRAATVRAHIKDCARVLSAQYIGKIQGERTYATRVINGVYHDEAQYWLPILRVDGTSITKPDGTRDKAIHVRGPRGEPLNSLKTFEYVQQPRVDFKLKVLGKSVSANDLEVLFTYGGVHGYGGERGDGEGRYTSTIEQQREAE